MAPATGKFSLLITSKCKLLLRVLKKNKRLSVCVLVPQNERFSMAYGAGARFLSFSRPASAESGISAMRGHFRKEGGVLDIAPLLCCRLVSRVSSTSQLDH